MLQSIRFFILRLIVGKTPAIANVNFVGDINVGRAEGLFCWDNEMDSITAEGEVSEFTRVTEFG